MLCNKMKNAEMQHNVAGMCFVRSQVTSMCAEQVQNCGKGRMSTAQTLRIECTAALDAYNEQQNEAECTHFVQQYVLM